MLQTLCDRNQTVATAESCTGGLIGAVITYIEGVGRALECSFVTYTDDAKSKILGLDPELIARCGAVSEPVARAMAEAALARSGADMAVSVTGFAGPAGPTDEEGLVHFALSRARQPTRHLVRRFGPLGRGPVRLGCLEQVIRLLEDCAAPPADA